MSLKRAGKVDSDWNDACVELGTFPIRWSRIMSGLFVGRVQLHHSPDVDELFAEFEMNDRWLDVPFIVGIAKEYGGGDIRTYAALDGTRTIEFLWDRIGSGGWADVPPMVSRVRITGTVLHPTARRQPRDDGMLEQRVGTQIGSVVAEKLASQRDVFRLASFGPEWEQVVTEFKRAPQHRRALREFQTVARRAVARPDRVDSLVNHALQQLVETYALRATVSSEEQTCGSCRRPVQPGERYWCGNPNVSGRSWRACVCSECKQRKQCGRTRSLSIACSP